MTKELKCSVIEEGTGGTSNASSLLETGKYSHRNTVLYKASSLNQFPF